MSFIAEMIKLERRLSESGAEASQLTITEIRTWYNDFKGLFPDLEEIINTPMYDTYVEYLYRFKSQFPAYLDSYCDIIEADQYITAIEIAEKKDDENSIFKNAIENWILLLHEGFQYLPQILDEQPLKMSLYGDNEHLLRFLRTYAMLIWDCGNADKAMYIYERLVLTDPTCKPEIDILIHGAQKYSTYTEYYYVHGTTNETEIEA